MRRNDGQWRREKNIKEKKNRERTYIHPYRDRKKKNCIAANQSEYRKRERDRKKVTDEY